MPLLRTTERIFIGYSAAQLSHKETAERAIASLNEANRNKHIELFVCEYRQMAIEAVHPQPAINLKIENSDLVILLFGASVGAGLASEARYTLELLKTGKIYKLIPYIFVEPPTNVGGGGGSGQLQGVDVEQFYQAEEVMYYKIEQPETFEVRLRVHLQAWIEEEERIVERQRDFLRRGLLRHFALDLIVFGDDILAIHRRDFDNLGANRETEAAYRRYVEAGDDAVIREEPLDYYLIARHLRDAVIRNLPEVLAATEFINPIHQYLAALVRENATTGVRDVIVRRYEDWLRARATVNERTRSFAAFQLGMLQARQSATLLLDTARNHGERKSVRHYAIYAMGMLRQRSMIVSLMDVHATETDGLLRDALTNSILFMMGVTE